MNSGRPDPARGEHSSSQAQASASGDPARGEHDASQAAQGADPLRTARIALTDAQASIAHALSMLGGDA